MMGHGKQLLAGLALMGMTMLPVTAARADTVIVKESLELRSRVSACAQAMRDADLVYYLDRIQERVIGSCECEQLTVKVMGGDNPVRYKCGVRVEIRDK